MKLKTDAEVIGYRDQLLKVYPKKDVRLNAGNNLTFRYSVIGTSNFKARVESQVKSIVRASHHGKILLQELAKLPKIADIVEYKTSHTAFHKDSIVVLHNATTPQGQGLARFESQDGQRLRGSLHPEMILAHELFHVGQVQKAKFFEPYCNLLCGWLGGPWEPSMLESSAIKYTNQIRIDKKMGYVRTHYSGYGGVPVDSYKKANARTNKK